jgi:hypothetical protein
MAGQPPFVEDDPMGIYQQILAGKIVFPRHFDRHAKSLIKKLLVADLTKRYGCLKVRVRVRISLKFRVRVKVRGRVRVMKTTF